MNILFLGCGGYVNTSLSYNSFIIDGTVLVETPPDITQSLDRENFPVAQISEIYISHMHGDHAFGFPFLAMRLFIDSVVSGKNRRVKIFVPGRGKEYLIQLVRMAVSEMHPLVKWVEENFDFIDASANARVSISGYDADLYRMDHYEETHGFILKNNERALLAYTADTLWCDAVASMITGAPVLLIADLGGEPNDSATVHMSEQNIITYGLVLAKEEMMIVGTHLKYQMKSSNPRLIYALPGMKINILNGVVHIE